MNIGPTTKQNYVGYDVDSVEPNSGVSRLQMNGSLIAIGFCSDSLNPNFIENNDVEGTI